MRDLSASARRVQEALDRHGLCARVRELTDSTRTATDAARAVGCDVAQIVKSLVFRGRESGRPIMAVVSGANRVDERKLSRAAGEKVGKADAEFVREHTGFAIGGVAPLGHPHPILTFIDEDLTRLERIWAAAGTPNALFELTPAELAVLSGGRVAQLRQD
jgi:prolyl-tRNA editing enzyme YbaK/EbsC (Cys-tRNA(Pro) deacylase)